MLLSVIIHVAHKLMICHSENECAMIVLFI